MYNDRIKEIVNMIRYDKLFDLMRKKGVKKTDLREIVSPNTVAKLSKNEYVGGEIIDRICTYFQCQPNDIMEVCKSVTYIDQFGQEQTKVVLVNQEQIDLLKMAALNPDVWNTLGKVFSNEDVSAAKNILTEVFKE